ncbi:MAG: DUF2786 domain-containing protein [Mycobacteriaceae bacterium]|nr:DUF2786 domain-containing protein [Mycobacteriaceae bacterium]
MAERNREKRLHVVGRLLAQASSVAGTPEAEAFTDRAFLLVAKYGADEFPGEATDAILRRDIPVQGAYLRQQVTLVIRIASALHCAYAYRVLSPDVAFVEVYGTKRHIDRIQILYGPLLDRMLHQPSASPWSSASPLSLEDRIHRCRKPGRHCGH